MKAEDIISIMLRNTAFPEHRMLKLQDYDTKSVERLRSSLKKLTAPDANGIRRLEADGVLDLWKIYEELSKKARPTSQTSAKNYPASDRAATVPATD